MDKKERQKLNKARIDLLDWVRDNKHQSLKYANKTALCDKINALFIPLIETPSSTLPSATFLSEKETNYRFKKDCCSCHHRKGKCKSIR